MADADAALYRAKNAGRAAFAIHGRDGCRCARAPGTDPTD
jgi:GGDEF domain-containing protein